MRNSDCDLFKTGLAAAERHLPPGAETSALEAFASGWKASRVETYSEIRRQALADAAATAPVIDTDALRRDAVARVTAIMALDEAQGRHGAALALAATEMTVDAVRAALAGLVVDAPPPSRSARAGFLIDDLGTGPGAGERRAIITNTPDMLPDPSPAASWRRAHIAAA